MWPAPNIPASGPRHFSVPGSVFSDDPQPPQSPPRNTVNTLHVRQRFVSMTDGVLTEADLYTLFDLIEDYFLPTKLHFPFTNECPLNFRPG